MKNRFLKPALALVLVAAMAVGGSLAYITATTDQFENKFVMASGDQNNTKLLDIDLDETFTVNNVDVEEDTSADGVVTATAEVMPGDTVVKNPVVSIEALDTSVLVSGAYIFVELTGNVTDVMELGYEMNTNDWEGVPGVDNVYYMEYTADVTSSTALPSVFSDTDALITADFEGPFNLVVDAYAIQKDNLDTPAAAWAAVSAE